MLCQMTNPYRLALRNIEEPDFDGHFNPKLADLRVALRMRVLAINRVLPALPWNLGKILIIGPIQVFIYFLDVLLISVGIQVLFFILMVLYFHRVSLISVFLNLVVIPLVGLLVPLGLVALLIFLVLPSMGLHLVEWCIGLTQVLLDLADYFATYSWGNYRIPTPPEWVTFLYLGSLGVILLFPFKLKSLRGFCAACCSACFLLILLHPFPARGTRGKLEITFLDVRQGDSAFVLFPDQTAWLIDGGGIPAQGFGEDFTGEGFDIGERVVSPFLWSKGVKTVEVIVLTHAHHDHIAGLNTILDNFSVKELWLGKNPASAEYLHFARKAVQKGVRIRFFVAGDQITAHGATLIFFNPSKNYIPGMKPHNNDSLAFRLDYGRQSLLMTGDIEKKIEAQVLKQHWPIHSCVLKVPHHGSRSSTTPGFLSQVSPVIAVISVGAPNPFGHPHQEVLQRLKDFKAQLFRTDRDGAVTLLTDGKLLEVRRFRD